MLGFPTRVNTRVFFVQLSTSLAVFLQAKAIMLQRKSATSHFFALLERGKPAILTTGDFHPLLPTPLCHYRTLLQEACKCFGRELSSLGGQKITDG